MIATYLKNQYLAAVKKGSDKRTKGKEKQKKNVISKEAAKDDGGAPCKETKDEKTKQQRKASSEAPQNQPNRDKGGEVAPGDAQQSKPAKGAEVVAKWVMRALDMGVEALRAEYRSLARYTMPDVTYEAFKSNHEAGRNRYQDVPCQDQHRVVIKWPGAPCDYIHANYVGTPISDKRFICTQGPLDGTIPEFWMMVLQEESETIIMLCNCIETGKFKCAEYWPNQVGMSKAYSGIEITNVQMRPMSPEEQSVIVSVLFIKFKKPDGTMEQREVRHYQWQDWPDRGVPPCRLTTMELLSRVRGTTKPIIVHCSAGIGRTGTIVAVEYILERMQAGKECAAMNDLLMELRNQRAYTIQNELVGEHERVLIVRYLRYESILTEQNQAKYRKFVEDYNIVTGTS